MLFILVIVLVVLALLLARGAKRGIAETGISLSGVSILHSDTGGGEELAQPLRSETHKIIGKPDYILKTPDGIIPVEVKPTRQATKPYPSDIMQLAAYCLLVEENFDTVPPFGLLRYANLTFKVKWDAELRENLFEILDEMRELASYPAYKGQIMPAPQHDMTAKCANCGFHYICWQD
jgi:CRISPR-associated exonuclease Cas4